MDIDNIGMFENFGLTEKRLDSAHKALSNFKKGDWGYNYWQRVINDLVKQLQRNENIMGNGLTMDPSHRR